VNSNPFESTKASDCSDRQINDLWVDAKHSSLLELLEPTGQMPIILLGSKGSGKTHLLRYCSQPLQLLRHGKITEAARVEKYLGFYCACSSLDSPRFRGKGIPDDQWADAFTYYLDLWLAQLVVQGLKELIAEGEVSLGTQKSVTREALELLLEPPAATDSPSNFEELISYFKDLQKSVDREVSNAAFTRQLAITVNAKPGSLVLGIPRILRDHVPALANIQFLFLIDELENFTVSQQRYVQTLIRDRQQPVSFRVGAMLHGLRTLDTLGGESNRAGAEFVPVVLDEKFRDPKFRYDDFVGRLCLRRFSVIENWDLTKPSLAQLFNVAPHNRDPYRFLVEHACSEVTRDSLPHLVRLRQVLNKACLPINFSEGLVLPEDPLVERFNIFLFYRALASKSQYEPALIERSINRIRRECQAFLENGTSGASKYALSFEHYKKDLAAQIVYSSKRHNLPMYFGFDNLIRMSEGITRNLLTLLKLTLKWAAFSGDSIGRGTISGGALSRGVKDASDWFYQDARDIGELEAEVKASLSRLSEVFRSYRFSDRPTEVSVICFAFDWNRVSATTKEIIEICEEWSLLIRVGFRKGRNSHELSRRYQLNRMLCPRWHLPVARRGTLDFTPEEVNSIFDRNFIGDFDTTLNRCLAPVMFPFGNLETPSTEQLRLDF